MKISKSQRAVYIMISILVAVVFWLYVDNTGANQRDVRLYNVPVTFVGAEDDLLKSTFGCRADVRLLHSSIKIM